MGALLQSAAAVRPIPHTPEEEDPTMLKQLSTVAVAMFLAAGVTTHAFAEDKAACEKQAEEKKLHGAAKNSFVKKCSGGAAAAKSPAAEACEKQAGEKKLHGAAKNSFVKKCTADAK
jgi:hypothetical protein